VGLKIQCVQEYPHPIRIRHLAFKNTAEVLKATIIDHHFIAGPELLKFLHKTIISNPGSNQVNDFIVDLNRLVVKTHKAVDTSGKAYSVVQLVKFESRKDVTGEQRLNHLRRPACELVVFFHLQLRRQSLYSPGHQVSASAILLFGMSMDHVPAKKILA
jgi:hypothetical protein